MAGKKKLDRLIEEFCTPPILEETEFDKKIYSGAQKLEIEFGNRLLNTYSVGTGKKILLVHGWGSRASHLSLLGKTLVKKGFNVIFYDLPGHGNSRKELTDTSNLFEFGKSISCVSKNYGNLYAVIGHSFGAMAAAFTILGTGLFAEYQFHTEKLILISSPKDMPHIIRSYCLTKNIMNRESELIKKMESAFHFKVNDYDLCKYFDKIKADVLIIHDEQDEEVPVTDAKNLNKKNKNSRLLLTSGSGHNKILMSREMLRAVADFM